MAEAVRRPASAVLQRSLLAVVAIAPVAAVVGGVVRGTHGLYGALLGSLLTLVFFGITVAVVERTKDASLDTLRVAVKGSFLAKLVVALAAVAVVGQVKVLDEKVFAVTVVAGVLVFLAAEAVVVLRGRVPDAPLDAVPTSPASAHDDDAAVAAARAARRHPSGPADA